MLRPSELSALRLRHDKETVLTASKMLGNLNNLKT